MGAKMPLQEDELYYWAWAQNLRLSYFDHPPMVAWMIRASTSVFGNNPFGVRFFACVSTFIVLFTLGKLCRTKNLLSWVILTPLIFFGGIMMTPDVPFLLFWALYLAWFIPLMETFFGWGDDPVARVYRSQPVSVWRWVLGGLILGLGFLSKYTMAFSVICGFFVLFTKVRTQAWWKGYLLHLVIAGLCFLPVLYFNYQHDWASFRYQWGHSNEPAAFRHLWDFIGTQYLLVGGLPFLMLLWVLFAFGTLKDNARFYTSIVFFVLPLSFFLYKATHNYLEANWALMAYLSFWIVAENLYSHNTIGFIGNGLILVGFIPPVIATLALFVHFIHPLSFIKPHQDRLGKIKAVYHVMEAVAEDIRINEVTEKVFLPKYQMVANLRYWGIPNAEQLYPPGRPSTFTLERQDACAESSILFVAETMDETPELSCFKSRDLLKEYPLNVRGETLSNYYLLKYYK